MSKAISINTVQGIGDIFWCYQKLAPYFDTINLRILCVDNGPIQQRAKEFCTMLPKVGTVEYACVPHQVYNKLAAGSYSLAHVLQANGTRVDYAVNAPLEKGVRLRDIDAGSNLEEFVDLGLPVHVPREDFLCLFVAGSKNSRVWKPEQWVSAAVKLSARIGNQAIALIGANWDKNIQAHISMALRRQGFTVANYVGQLGLADSVDVIRRARFFLGYQSGLNVIADNYDVPQLMVYFQHLEPMMYTWPKPANVGTRFHAGTFAQPDGLVDSVPSAAWIN